MAERLLVVLPTYNESRNLSQIVPVILSQDDRIEVLVVDDNSPDGTGTFVEEWTAREPRLHVLHRPAKLGLGGAYITGFQWALANTDATYIFEMDADFSHDPRHLPALIAAAGHADVVIGSRYVPGGAIRNWPKRRRLLSRLANTYIRQITRLNARDCTSGYRCWRREALAALPLDGFISDGYSFLVEMLFVAAGQGSRMAEVPITFVERRQGESKLSRAVLLESALTPWRLIARGRSSANRP